MRAGVQQVLALEVDRRPSQVVAEPTGVEERRRPPGIVPEQTGELVLEPGIALDLAIRRVQAVEGGDKNLGGVAPAPLAEVA